MLLIFNHFSHPSTTLRRHWGPVSISAFPKGVPSPLKSGSRTDRRSTQQRSRSFPGAFFFGIFAEKIDCHEETGRDRRLYPGGGIPDEKDCGAHYRRARQTV